MSKQHGKYPINFRIEILQRFLNDKEIAEIYDDYKEHKHSRGGYGVQQPNDIDKRMYERFKELRSMKETAESFKVSTSRIASAVGRVVAWSK